MGRKEAITHIEQWVVNHVSENERERFREVTGSDLLNLHEGSFARLQVRPSEFAAWQAVWENKELVFTAPEERYDFGREAV